MALRVISHEPASPEALRDELIEENLPLAQRLAGRYRNSGEPVEDLTQVACLGLIKAADRYDPARGPFPRFAVPTITGELKRHFRDRGWGIRMPRDLQERAMDVSDAIDVLATDLGRSPTPYDIAAFMGLDVERVLEAMEAASAYAPMSLDTPGSTDDDGDIPPLVQQVGRDDPGFEAAEWRPALEPALRALAPREREILRLRFADDLTQSEIAERIGVSQMHVSRLLRRTLARLSATAA